MRGALQTMTKRLVGSMLAASLVMQAAAVHAEEPPAPVTVDAAAEARRAYDAGAQAYAAKRFVEAALYFEAAAGQRAHAVTLYTAALAWEQANRPDRAADDYKRALDVPGLSAEHTAVARERLGVLEKLLGAVDVVAPEGARVQLDALTDVAAPARLHATAGVHTLTVRVPGKPIVKRDVSLELGRVANLAFTADSEESLASPRTAPPAPPAASIEITPPPPLEKPTLDVRRAVGAGIVGVGLATLAGGAVLGVNALGARDAYNAAPSHAGFDHASSLETWTNIAFVAGGLTLASGLALMLWPSSHSTPEKVTKRVTAAPTLGGIVVRGAF